MKIGGQYKPEDVYLRHFHKLGADTKAAQSVMKRQIKTMTKKMLEAAPRLKTSLAEERLVSDVFDDIIAVIKDRAQRLSE